MSDQILLEVQPRDTLGKGVKTVRANGFVPAVIHDHGKASIHIQAEYQAFAKAFHSAGRHHPIELTVDGKKYTALIRDVTRDPKLNHYTHVVFNAVSANQKVDADVPVKPQYAEGNEASPAERAGLIVLSQLDEVAVKALPKNLPDELFYDAEKLVSVGDHITVADLIIPAGVEIETDMSHAVAAVFEPSALAAANEATAGEAENEATAAEAEASAEGESATAEQPTA